MKLLSLLVVLAGGSTADGTLRVDGFALSIGSVSVGLPTTCTADVVLSRYLDLVRIVDGIVDTPGYVVSPADVDALAAATNLDTTTVRRRLQRLSR